MVKHDKEEQLKDKIFTIFSEYQREAPSDRRQVYFVQLCDQIYKWCRDYRFKENIDEMGLEISLVTRRIMKDSAITNIPEQRDDFFNYLNVSLKKGKAAYYRGFREKEVINIKGKRAKLKSVEDVIWMKQSSLGRKITSDEEARCISEWFKFGEYTELLNKLHKNRVSYGEDTAAPPYSRNSPIDPLDEYLSMLNTEAIRNAIESVFKKRREKKRNCCRAVFTLYCIEKVRDYSGLIPILDEKIIERCTNNTDKPKQYEIYLEHFPDVTKNSADASASKMLKDFRKDLESHLKVKNLEIFP